MDDDDLFYPFCFLSTLKANIKKDV